MSETAFLAAIEAFLADAGLVPAPATIGPFEPAEANDLPAVILSLGDVRRLGAGLGERSSLIIGGALAVRSPIDLADPVLPEEPTFQLLSADRLTLILPHGGQVRTDGSIGPLGPLDIQVQVAGAARTIVAGAPGPGQVRPDPIAGTLRFGAPLPAAGIIIADYFLGQWERRVTPLAGRLRVEVLADDAAALRVISDLIVERLLAAAADHSFRGLRKLALTELDSIAGPDSDRFGARARRLVFAFDYEHEVDRPESSGGIIRRVPIITDIDLVRFDEVSGGIVIERTREESG
jgi:hypothetical protein